MAPLRQREPSIERTPEYEEFMEKLAAYHEARGTTLEREPKAGPRHLDLFKLYKRVTAEGGYDWVSNTKENKLAWRRIAQDFLPGNANVTTLAFIVKSAYYKNLAAYEITHFHKREPPPKEILEDVSAKGGDLLNRTLENFHRPTGRETENTVNGRDRDSDESDEEHKTPKEAKMDVDEPESTGRVTRALRHAPPQRVLFQPDTSSSRQTRQSANTAPGSVASPTPGASAAPSQTNGTYSSTTASMTLTNYEPRVQPPSNVKPVLTPSNAPDHFRNLRLKQLASSQAGRNVQQYKGMMLPGTGFSGPNIYIRALLALQSDLVEEQQYALHHLVKISHERGDKYRFDGFPGLAETLIHRALDIGSLFYDVKWEISYEDEPSTEVNVLSGLYGTADLIERIKTLPLLDITDTIETQEFSRALNRANEAALVLRNMVMMDENAQYASRIPSIRDFIVVVLNLPQHPAVVEIRHYAFEIAEQLTKYWTLDSNDPLYRSLLANIDSADRGTIINSLRAISRISMNLETKNRLDQVPPSTLQKICDWLLVEDEDLRNACLDFLYQYTAVTENVDFLLKSVDTEALVEQLVRLLLYNANFEQRKERNGPAAVPASSIGEDAPRLSAAIIEQLAGLDEPMRSAQWLRTCYEEDPTHEVTQIALWQAYNQAFNPILASQTNLKPLMAAKDFITNVTTTFPTAVAQVMTTSTKQQRYYIRGIKPRIVPVDPSRGRPYMRCQWREGADVGEDSDTECGEFSFTPQQVWEHILLTHLQIPRDPETGKWLLESKPDVGMLNGDETAQERRYTCQWAGCRHFDSSNGSPDPFVVGMHIKTHLPDTSAKSSLRAKHNRLVGQFDEENLTRTALGALNVPPLRWFNTATDERSDAAGLPLASVLVLRNLARQMGKLDYPSEERRGCPFTADGVDGDGSEEDQGAGGWVEHIFAPVKDQLFFVLAHNASLKSYLVTLLNEISNGGG